MIAPKTLNPVHGLATFISHALINGNEWSRHHTSSTIPFCASSVALPFQRGLFSDLVSVIYPLAALGDLSPVILQESNLNQVGRFRTCTLIKCVLGYIVT